MLDVKVREIMDKRLKADETILWADSADPLVRAESQGMKPKDRIWNYLGAV